VSLRSPVVIRLARAIAR